MKLLFPKRWSRRKRKAARELQVAVIEFQNAFRDYYFKTEEGKKDFLATLEKIAIREISGELNEKETNQNQT